MCFAEANICYDEHLFIVYYKKINAFLLVYVFCSDCFDIKIYFIFHLYVTFLLSPLSILPMALDLSGGQDRMV